ncbi:hypothetical protein [Actinophytocola sp.]
MKLIRVVLPAVVLALLHQARLEDDLLRLLAKVLSGLAQLLEVAVR